VIRRYITLILVILISGLLIAIANKYNFITVQKLKANKDFIGSLKDVMTITAIIFGVIVTYYRFFIGRTFSQNANIEIAISIFDVCKDNNLHCIMISFKNVGNLAIWNPKANIYVKRYEEGKFYPLNEIYDIEELSGNSSEKLHEFFVNSSETLVYCHHLEIPKKILITNYIVEIVSSNKSAWSNSITIKNVVDKENCS
jgi:hypothetical protein